MKNLHRIIYPDGRSTMVTLDRHATLQDYYGWIGCDMIEVIHSANGKYEMILDEESKMKDPVPPTNPVACDMAGTPHVGDYRIVGIVVAQAIGTMQ